MSRRSRGRLSISQPLVSQPEAASCPGRQHYYQDQPDRHAASGTGITGGLNGPIAIAFDKGGNAWVANQQGSSLSVFDSTGTPVTGSPFTNGGVSNPSSIAVDGDNHVWVANFTSTVGIAEYEAATHTPISPATSFYGGYYTKLEYT